MGASAALSVFFAVAKEEQRPVYVQTISNSVYGIVVVVHTDGVDIERSGGIVATIPFSQIIIAEGRVMD